MSKAADLAYKRLRAGILDGTLPPGSQLKEEELAELCGVSRTPVREAMRRLESEMLVRRTDTQRSYVADWSITDIDEMFTLRGMLEGYAASRAAQNMSAEKLAELQACNDALGKAVARKPAPDVEGFLRHNRQFHGIIIEASGSERLKTLLVRLVEQPIVHRTALGYDRSNLAQSHAEHEELIRAIGKRDTEWARTIMSGHIRRAFHVYAENYMRQNPPDKSSGGS